MQKRGKYGPLLKQKTIFLQNRSNNKVTKQIISFPKLFILSKYHMVWLSYEWFSILCDVFLLKRIISSHSSCVLLHTYPIFMHFKFQLTNKAGILIYLTPKKRNESRRYMYSTWCTHIMLSKLLIWVSAIWKKWLPIEHVSSFPA